MRAHALTYPQLARQAMAAGWGNTDLRRLRAAYDSAQRRFDGYYRAAGQPFTCHTVRTAGIVLAEDQPVEVVLAALVHAAYERHRYDGTTATRPGRRLRAGLRREVGIDVEALVWQYHLIDRTDSGGRAEGYRRLLEDGGELMRRVMVLRVANELEDHLDLVSAHRDVAFRDRVLDAGPGMVALARTIGLPVIADELEVAYAETLDQVVAPAVRWNRRRAYALPGRARGVMAGVVRGARRLRRRARRSRRRGWPSSPTPVPAPAPVPVRPTPPRPRILVTGAAGQVGRVIIPLLREAFALRLLDLQPLTPEGDDEVLRADIRGLGAVRAAMEGVTAVVHLAGRGHDAAVDDLVAHNVDGTAQVFEAARQAGVGKVVYASSAQVVGGYGPEDWVTADLPVRPINAYACTKVFGEALARLYAERFGLSVTCLRIGWFEAEVSERQRSRPEMRRIWCSPGDLAQLILKSIDADVGFAVLFAVSDNEGRNWDLEEARRTVGYESHDGATRPPQITRSG